MAYGPHLERIKIAIYQYNSLIDRQEIWCGDAC